MAEPLKFVWMTLVDSYCGEPPVRVRYPTFVGMFPASLAAGVVLAFNRRADAPAPLAPGWILVALDPGESVWSRGYC